MSSFVYELFPFCWTAPANRITMQEESNITTELAGITSGGPHVYIQSPEKHKPFVHEYTNASV